MSPARHESSVSDGHDLPRGQILRHVHRQRAAGLALVILGAMGCGASDSVEGADDVRTEFEHAAMGTLFRATLYAGDAASAESAARLAFERIDAIEGVATDYDARSEARRLSESALLTWVPVSADLALVLRASDRAVTASGGAFDPTVGSLTRLWRRALRDGEWPRPERWAAARAGTGWKDVVQLEERGGALFVRLEVEGVRLDFGGIAKGVAVDEALRALERAGVHRALVDGGGDLAALDAPPGETGWRVEVAPFGPDGEHRMRFMLARAAIATSGDLYRSGHLEGDPPPGIEGTATHYGHVLDARTGSPLPSPRAAIMTAGTATEADALATARLVLGAAVTAVPGLERGVFLGPGHVDACVGADFPHDGAARVPLDRAADPRRDTSTGDLPPDDRIPHRRDE